MIKIFAISDSTENRISYYHLLVFLVLTLQNLLLSSVFLLHLAGMIHSRDKLQALKDAEIMLAILIFPFAFSADGLELRKYKTRLCMVFGLTCVFTILYLYADAFRIILYHSMPLRSLFSPVFMNHNFSEPIGLHATYLSMFAVLSAAIFIYFFNEKPLRGRRWLYIIFLLILLAGLLQLASRAALVAFITILLVFPLFKKKGRIRSAFIIAVIIITGLILLGITQIDAFKKRYMVEFREDLAISPINNELTESRAERWDGALQLIKESPFIGHGSGSEKRLLMEKYFESGFYNSYLNELNAHNQYLSMLINTGILGLSIYLLTILYGFAAALRNRDPVFISFMTLISIVGFSENILDVNKGIFFYAFFFSFFIKCGNPLGLSTRFIKKRL